MLEILTELRFCGEQTTMPDHHLMPTALSFVEEPLNSSSIITDGPACRGVKKTRPGPRITGSCIPTAGTSPAAGLFPSSCVAVLYMTESHQFGRKLGSSRQVKHRNSHLLAAVGEKWNFQALLSKGMLWGRALDLVRLRHHHG